MDKKNDAKYDIKSIEDELSTLIASDKKSWIRIYELMEEVDRESLYQAEYRSYTAWVNSLAERFKVHVSLLWSRKKAGKVYSEYAARMAKRGVEVAAIESISVSPDNFVLVEKIAGRNADVADDLIQKVVDGDLKRSDLKNAWAMARYEREERGEKATFSNGYERKKAMESKESTESNKATATDIVLALSKSSGDWLKKCYGDDVYVNLNVGVIKKDCRHRLLTEFAVQTGSSRHARRIDALVVETYSVEDQYSVGLHGIEIKVSKSDLKRDHKMQEYADYCDYFWIAIPEELVDTAKDLIVDGWGILAYDKNNGNMEPVVRAKRHDAIFRDMSMSTALNKLI